MTAFFMLMPSYITVVIEIIEATLKFQTHLIAFSLASSWNSTTN